MLAAEKLDTLLTKTLFEKRASYLEVLILSVSEEIKLTLPTTAILLAVSPLLSSYVVTVSVLL